MHVWQELDYSIDVCRVTHGARTKHLQLSKKKKKVISFPVAVNNSIKVGPLVFLLWMFVITENIMKFPVYYLLLIIYELIFCDHMESLRRLL